MQLRIIDMQNQDTVLVCGATGAIGSVIADYFRKNNCEVVPVARKETRSIFAFDPFSQDISSVKKYKFNAVCFAQGMNINDSIYDFDIKKHVDVYNGNCLYVIQTLHLLLKHNLLSNNSKICIISSIWQNITRQEKLSYSVSKAALRGLVNSLSLEMGKDNHLVNAILPGVIDTEMTRKTLSHMQLENMNNSTMFKRLPSIDDIATLAFFLCSSKNTSINGQFISVDLGVSNAKIF